MIMATKKTDSRKQKITEKASSLVRTKNGKNKHAAKSATSPVADPSAPDLPEVIVAVDATAAGAPKGKGKRAKRANGKVEPSAAGGIADGQGSEMLNSTAAEAGTSPSVRAPKAKGRRAKPAGATNGTTAPTSDARPARDPRLPEPGTVLRKVDRHGAVRCECTVDEDGVRYQGTTYRSLSAAAVAAANDLGIKGAQNGYVFWGLVKPPRATSENPLLRLQKTWDRYVSCARSTLTSASDDQKPELLAAIERHREEQLDAQ
jgi:hypothetical protein